MRLLTALSAFELTDPCVSLYSSMVLKQGTGMCEVMRRANPGNEWSSWEDVVFRESQLFPRIRITVAKYAEGKGNRR